MLYNLKTSLLSGGPVRGPELSLIQVVDFDCMETGLLGCLEYFFNKGLQPNETGKQHDVGLTITTSRIAYKK